MIPPVEFPDPELWLCSYVRAKVDDADVLVTNAWPEPLPNRRIIVIRYDGGQQESYLTEESLYGVTVLGALGDNAQAVMNLARRARSLLGNCWGIDGPFADCRYTSGPIRIENPTRPQRYFTAALVTVASAI